MVLLIDDKNHWIGGISGALAGAVTATAVCPLDVLRTRLQIQTKTNARYNGISSLFSCTLKFVRGALDGVQRIIMEEGIVGLYRGLSPTLIALIPNWAVYFSTYEYLKHSLSLSNKRKITPASLLITSVLIAGNGSNHLVHVISAAGAGFSTLMVTNPLWVVKTRMQIQHMGLSTSWGQYSGTLHALLRIIREEGYTKLYAGVVPSLLGLVHVCIQFPLYEHLRATLAQRQDKSPDQLTVNELIFSSTLAKTVASVATYPHEVLRSHMHVNGQATLTGLIETFHHIKKDGGILGFYRGCGVNLCRTVPAAAITLTSFELINRFLKNTFSSEIKILQSSQSS